MGLGAPSAYAFAQFQSVIAQYNASGERFRIDSHCQTACTMFLSIRNVCITPGATLLFHAGGSVRKGIIIPSPRKPCSAAITLPCRDYFTANHFMKTFAFHPISGPDMIRRFGYEACS
jgi:hypothetical protein